MHRRRLLTACGTVVTGLLAGCSGGDGDSTTATSTATATATTTAEPTATATAEPTATATEEPTATATPVSGPDGPTHGLDESFTVGTGQDAIGYRIIDFYRAEEIGGSANSSTADGTYLIILLELSNPQNEAITYPQNKFILTNEEQIRYIDDDATPKLSDDARIDAQPLGTATVLSGGSKTGAVVFDLDLDRSYWIEIRPTGDSGEKHYVQVGPISEVQELQSSRV